VSRVPRSPGAVRRAACLAAWLAAALPAPGVAAQVSGADTAAVTEGDAVLLAPLQVTQGVQSPDNRIPLVGRRDTWVRARLALRASPGVRPAGWLRVEAAGVIDSVKSAPLIPAATGAPPVSGSGSPEAEVVLDFHVPDGFTAPGSLRAALVAVYDSATDAPIGCAGCADAVAEVEFGPETVLRVRVVGFRVLLPNGTWKPGPRVEDFEWLRRWLGRTYPVSQVEMDTVTVDMRSTLVSCESVIVEVARIRALDMDGGVDPRTHYYGMVPDDGPLNKKAFMRGCSLAISDAPDASVVAAGPAGIGFPDEERFRWDTDGSYADFYGAHELGHTFGLRHVDACRLTGDEPAPVPPDSGRVGSPSSGVTGFDPATRAEYGYAAWHDLMTYCPRQWISGRSYVRILERLRAEDSVYAAVDRARKAASQAQAVGLPGAAALGAQLAAGLAPADSLLQVIVEITDLDRGTVGRVAVFGVSQRGRPAAVDRAVVDTVPALRRVELVVMDERQAPLRRDTTWAMLDRVVPPAPGNTRRTAVVNAFIGDVPGARSVCVIRGTECARRVERRDFSLRPVGGSHKLMMDVEPGFWRFSWVWTAAVLVTGVVYYPQLSVDDGRTWVTVGQTQRKTFDLSCSRVTGHPRARLRVIAYDGVERGQLYDSRDLFTPGQNPCPPPPEPKPSG
jgi:hypothetical protein